MVGNNKWHVRSNGLHFIIMDQNTNVIAECGKEEHAELICSLANGTEMELAKANEDAEDFEIGCRKNLELCIKYKAELDSIKEKGVRYEANLRDAWEHLRSVLEVAHRKGTATNWEAFERRTLETIEMIVRALSLVPKIPNMCVTAKGFQFPNE